MEKNYYQLGNIHHIKHCVEYIHSFSETARHEIVQNQAATDFFFFPRQDSRRKLEHHWLWETFTSMLEYGGREKGSFHIARKYLCSLCFEHHML